MMPLSTFTKLVNNARTRTIEDGSADNIPVFVHVKSEGIIVHVQDVTVRRGKAATCNFCKQELPGTEQIHIEITTEGRVFTSWTPNE